MKIRKLFLCIVLLSSFMFLIINCSTTGKKMVRNPIAVPYGIWVNPDYNGIQNKSAKVVYNPNGIWTAFDHELASVHLCTGTITLTDKWVDKEGNSWYKVTTNQRGFHVFVFELWKINSSGTTMEGVWSVENVPDKLDKNDPSYTIYYRDTDEIVNKTEV